MVASETRGKRQQQFDELTALIRSMEALEKSPFGKR